MSDLYKNQKLDSDFIENVILKSPDLQYKIISLKRLKKYQTALKLADQVICSKILRLIFSELFFSLKIKHNVLSKKLKYI